MEGRLERLVAPAYLTLHTAAALNTAKLLYGRESFPPFTRHIGDYFLAGAPVIASEAIGNAVVGLGKRRNLSLLVKLGNCLPAVATALTSSYLILGESVLPQILPGTADVRDIPAALAGAATAYVLRKEMMSALE